MFKFTVRNCNEEDIYVMDEVDWKTTMSRVGIVASACAAIGATLARNAIDSNNAATTNNSNSAKNDSTADQDSKDTDVTKNAGNNSIMMVETTGFEKENVVHDENMDLKNVKNEKGSISAPAVIAAAVAGGLIAEELLRSNAGNWEEYDGAEDVSTFKSKANKIKPRQKYEFKSNNPTNRRVIILDPHNKFWRGSCWNKDHYIFGPIYNIVGPHGSIYQESIEMLSGSSLIYTFANLRKIVRDGKLKSCKLKELEPPIAGEHFLGLLNKIKGDFKVGTNDAKDFKEMWDSLKNRHAFEKNSTMMLPSLEKFGDDEYDANGEKTQESHPVYGITTNHAKKRITVVFRGSVTTMDWVQNSHFAMKDVTITDTSTRKERDVKVHTGFHDYLFQKRGSGSTYSDITKTVKTLLNKYPDYDLYSTGHSLGGALATLFGFFAASDQEIRELTGNPVQVISIASPMVGNSDFVDAFQSLEQEGRLCHLRIVNADDVVPTLPTMSATVASSPDVASSIYWHCGMKLRLMKDSIKITHPKGSESNRTLTVEKKLFKNAKTLSGVKNHGCKEYETRLVTFDEDLRDETITGLYKKHFFH